MARRKRVMRKKRNRDESPRLMKDIIKLAKRASKNLERIKAKKNGE